MTLISEGRLDNLEERSKQLTEAEEKIKWLRAAVKGAQTVFTQEGDIEGVDLMQEALDR